jgi:hypothetical protein
MIQNVHTTVDRIFQSPQYRNVKNYNDSIQLIYSMVNNSYTDYHWIMTSKQYQPQYSSSADSYYFNCFNCFTTIEPTGQYYYLIAGVPQGVTPNTNYLSQKAFWEASNRYPSAKDLANSIFNGFCLAGIEALSMYEDLEDIYPIEWNGVSERTNDPGTMTIRFWSY